MACAHNPHLVRKRFAWHESYCYQCIKCGKRVGFKPQRRHLTAEQMAGARLWNSRLRHRGSATARSRRYQEYLASPAWKKLRQLILERDGYQCLLCGEEATEVHHTSYERFGRERPTDLISVCRDCNQDARQLGVGVPRGTAYKLQGHPRQRRM